MMFMRRHEGARQGELAALLEVEDVTLSRHIDRLEESGWVERRRDPTDRRAWRLFLDDKSRPILDQLAAVLIETRETALAGFSATDRTRLINNLMKIKSNLIEADATEVTAENEAQLAVGAAD